MQLIILQIIYEYKKKIKILTIGTIFNVKA